MNDKGVREVSGGVECPDCGAILYSLKHCCWSESDFKVWANGTFTWTDPIFLEKDQCYKCPECGVPLFENEEDAVNFLKGMAKESRM